LTRFDDPRLPNALLAQRRGALASLPLFMYVMIRHALRRAGEEDRVLADYVTSVLLHFALRGRAERVADGDDEVYTRGVHGAVRALRGRQ
jgi:hypothetical protein